MGPRAAQAERTARQVHHSDALQVLARVGLLGRALVWLLVGGIAAAVALGTGGGGQEADRQGALRTVAMQPLGEAVLWVVVVGFAGYALWRVLAAAVGHTDEDGEVQRWLQRGVSLFIGVLYGSLAYSSVRFLLGDAQQSGDQETSSRAAQVMSLPYGRWLLGVIGVVVVGIGVVNAVLALRREHDERLDVARMPSWMAWPASALGVVGRVGRGAVIALVGVFVVRAAWMFDPEDAKGLDATLATVAAQPHGTVLLLLAALGLVAFGLWSLVEAVWRDL